MFTKALQIQITITDEPEGHRQREKTNTLREQKAIFVCVICECVETEQKMLAHNFKH